MARVGALLAALAAGSAVKASAVLRLPGVVEQGGARVPVGGAVRFYTVGSSTAAWQTWPDQLHAMLKRLGHNVSMRDFNVPGATFAPSKSPICANSGTFRQLRTPRLGMIGWSSWGFAYNSTADCDTRGFRSIAGYNVSCTNAWACNPEWTGTVPLVPLNGLVNAVRDAHFVILANWINDGKQAQQTGPRQTCYDGGNIDFQKSVAVTVANLKRVIRAVHAKKPNVTMLVLARYPDTREVVYSDESSLPAVLQINAAVREAIKGEPNTFFVDFSFPLNLPMFQTLSLYHPNCRGDKVMATAVLETLFQQRVLSRGLDLGAPEACLAASECSLLNVSCCQRAAQCYLASNSSCMPYGPGQQ